MLITFPAPKLSEISKYYQSKDYISHTDSRKSITDKLYHIVKKYMLRRKLSWINNKFEHKGRILDIGAGTGDFLLEAKRAGWKVSGVEPNEEARKKAKTKGIKLFGNADNYKSNKLDRKSVV